MESDGIVDLASRLSELFLGLARPVATALAIRARIEILATGPACHAVARIAAGDHELQCVLLATMIKHLPVHHIEALKFAVLYSPKPGEQPGRERLLAQRERCELLLQGRGWIEHDGAWIEVTTGDLVWNIPGDFTIGRSDPENPFTCLAMDFVTSADMPRPALRVSRWDDIEEREEFARRVNRMMATPGMDRRLLGIHLYTTLLLQAQLWAIRSPHPAMPPQLRRVTAIIDERFADRLDIVRLAKAVGWSASHLHAAFRQHLGTTPHQYLIRRRINAVCDALLNFGDGLDEIACANGFSNAHVLIRAFRRHMGTTPIRWQASHT